MKLQVSLATARAMQEPKVTILGSLKKLITSQGIKCTLGRASNSPRGGLLRLDAPKILDACITYRGMGPTSTKKPLVEFSVEKIGLNGRKEVLVRSRCAPAQAEEKLVEWLKQFKSISAPFSKKLEEAKAISAGMTFTVVYEFDKTKSYATALGAKNSMGPNSRLYGATKGKDAVLLLKKAPSGEYFVLTTKGKKFEALFY